MKGEARGGGGGVGGGEGGRELTPHRKNYLQKPQPY